MIYITGDTHGDFDRFTGKNWPMGEELTKDDYVIICGDFGGLWNFPGGKFYDEREYWLQRLSNKNWTTLFIDGNHENHVLLNELPQIEKFEGIVGKVRNSIFHLRRGQIYTIDNKKFFCFGGAQSIDKHMRKDGISWWKEELPSIEEEQTGLENLEKNQYEVDYIITHTAPKTVVRTLGYGETTIVTNPYSTLYDNTYDSWKYFDPTTTYLEHIAQTVKFKKWYFGHFHEFKQIGRYITLYKKIIKLEE